MKKRGILHHELSEVIATLGHTDMLVIADAGLPIPPGVRRIDLAVTGGVPGFTDVLKAVLDEVQVDYAIMAREMRKQSSRLRREAIEALAGIPAKEVSHERFKMMTREARAVVRTGEFTPYANIILVSGVTF